MSAPVVGTNKAFDLAVDDLITQAIESLGGEHVTSKDAKLGRTALNLIFIDIQNRGAAPLASFELVSVALVSGSSLNYPLGTDVFNVFETVVQVSTATGQTLDLALDRISMSDWISIPNKHTEGRPTQYMVDKQRDNHFIHVWPVPNQNSKYSLKAWTLKRVSDVDQARQLVDFPHRYLPAIVKGLRFYLADLKGAALDKLQWYKMEYYEALDLVMTEDRERTDFVIQPYVKLML